MTTLTWRDVAAPNLNGVADAFRVSNETLNNAFDAASKGIQRFDSATNDRVNSDILAQIAAARTPDEAKALAEAASKDPNRIRYSPATMATLMGRAGDLTKQAAAESDFRFVDWGRSQERERAEAQRGADPIISEALLANYGGHRDQALAILNDPNNKATLGKLSASQFLASITGNNTVERDTTSNDTSRQNLKESTTKFNWEELDHNEATAVTNNVAKFLPEIESGAEIDGVLNSDPEFKKLSGKVQLGIRAGLQGLIGGGGSGGTGGAVGGGPQPEYRQGSAYNTVLGDGQFGLPDRPVSDLTIGEALDFGRSTLIPKSKAAGIGRDERGLLGSSAMGAYQFTGETLERYAPRILGSNWRNQKLTAANQDALAEAIFNDSKNGNLKKVWAGLPNATPGAYANKSWDEVKHLIVAHETGGTLDPRKARQATQGTMIGLQFGSGADPARDFGRDLQAVWGKSDDLAQVTAQLVGAQGADGIPYAGVLAGAPKEEVASQIRRIQQNYQSKYQRALPAPIAASVLARSLKSKQDGGFMEKYAGTGWLGRAMGGQVDMGGYFIDKNLERETLNYLGHDGGKGLLDSTVSDIQTNEGIQNLGTAQQAYQLAVAEVTRRRQLVASGAKSQAILAPALAQLRLAEDNLKAAQRSGFDKTNETLGTKPEPKPTPKPVARARPVMPATNGRPVKAAPTNIVDIMRQYSSR